MTEQIMNRIFRFYYPKSETDIYNYRAVYLQDLPLAAPSGCLAT